MGIWIVIAIVLFVLGSIMALKPSGVDLRLDKLRMTARRLELNPKLVATPKWVRGRNNEFGRGMIGQYALVLDGTKLPETYYQIINGELRPYLEKEVDNLEQNIDNATQDTAKRANYLLDKEPLQLPDSIQPFVKAIYSKANSLVVFWDDSHYVRPITNPNYNPNTIEPDLLALKSKMLDWAEKLSQKS